MNFEVGDKVKLVRMEDEADCYKKYLDRIFTVKKVYSTFVTFVENTEENIGPYLKNLELVKDYTYEDLKKSPIGTKITFENGEVLVKDDDGNYSNKKRWRDDSDLKGLKDKVNTLGKIIKIEEPEYQTVYESKPEILDEAEKRYLRGVLKPFRGKVTYIKKFVYPTGDAKIDINVENWYTCLPLFPKNKMYKNMEEDKKYTLEELGL